MASNKLQAFTRKHKNEIYHVLLCIAGSFILAFGTTAFLIPSKIVAGGTSGIGMLADYFVSLSNPDLGIIVNNIVVWTINIGLLITAFFLVSKKFAIHTLVSTLFFPAFYSLMTLTPMISWLTQYFVEGSKYLNDAVRIVLAGIFAGSFIGIGVSLTFLGDGSTGGLDVVYFLIYKYLKIKQSISSFVLDAAIIIVYAAATADHLPEAGMGVVSALISAIMIEFIYVRPRRVFLVYIVSEKYNEVNKYLTKVNIKNKLTNEKYKDGNKIIESNVTHHEFKKLKAGIYKIDANALISEPNYRLLADHKK